MTDKKTLNFLLMDPPYENARTTTALRLIDLAVKKGHDVNVFAYEGGVYLPFAKQTAHPNAVHGRDAEQEEHPLPKDWVASIKAEADRRGSSLEWINCGLCVDERGAGEALPFVRRGTPADFLKAAESTAGTLVIPTK